MSSQTQKTGEPAEHAKGITDTAKEKIAEAKQMGQEKWEQAKQGLSDVTQSAKDKTGGAAPHATQDNAAEGKEQTGSVLQQAGNAVKGVIGKVTGGEKHQ